MKLVDTGDLKSPVERRAGSSPAPGTINTNMTGDFMLSKLFKIFKRKQKTPVIIEYFNASTFSDIAVHSANNTGIIAIFSGENLEKRMRRWVKENQCRIIHRYTFSVE